MPKINRSISVSFTPEQMYNLVNAPDQYPEFLPWCSEGTIDRVSDNEMEATIHFSHGILSKSFTTLNALNKNKSIYMKLLEGPFRKFEGSWRFDQVENQAQSCNLSFDLEFEFSSPLIAMAAGPVFHQAISSMIEAFVKRAEALYNS